MTIEELVLAKLRELRPEKQKDLLRFLDSLQPNGETAKPLTSLEGRLEDLRVDFSEEEIAQARREMWGNFPRDVS